MAKYDISKILEKRNAPVNNSAEVEKEYNMLFGLDNAASANMTAKEIRLDRIILFPNDPFKPYTEEQLKNLADSIAELGLLEPVVLRPDPEGRPGYYQMLAGRHRKMACEMNNKKTILAFIHDVDDDTAIMIVTETNLKKRDKLLPSEKAWAYRMQLEAVKKQGKRSDLAENTTSAHNGWKSETAHIVAEKNDCSKNEIRRYIRLSYLITALLDLADENKLSLLAGVDISYLDEASQLAVHKYFFIEPNNRKLDTKLSALIREEFNKKKSLDKNSLVKLLAALEKKQEKPKPFTINRKEFSGYNIPGDRELKRLFMEFLDSKFKQAEK